MRFRRDMVFAVSMNAIALSCCRTWMNVTTDDSTVLSTEKGFERKIIGRYLLCVRDSFEIRGQSVASFNKTTRHHFLLVPIICGSDLQLEKISRLYYVPPIENDSHEE